MPFKNPQEYREYMRLYMRDRKAEKKATEAEATLEKAKLEKISFIIRHRYKNYPYENDAELREKPKFKTVPVQQVKTVATGKVTRSKMVFDEFGSLVKSKPTTTKVKFKEKGPIVGSARVPVEPGPPPTWIPHIKQIQAYALSYGRNVSEYHIYKDIKFWMRQPFSDLTAESWRIEQDNLMDRIKKLVKLNLKNSPKYSRKEFDRLAEKWKEGLNRWKELVRAFEKFALVGVVDGVSDDNIIRAAKDDDRVCEYFNYETEDFGRSRIRELRGYLNKPDETKPHTQFKPVPSEDMGKALDTLETSAKLDVYKKAQQLVDYKREHKFEPQKKEKKATYSVTVDSEGS